MLLIIAHAGYHPVEYGHMRAELENAGIKVVVASDQAGTADAHPSVAHTQQCSDPNCGKVADEYPQFAQAPIDISLKDVNPDEVALFADFDGIFIIGGPGALEFLDNEITYSIMRQAAAAHRPFGAICISPRILAKAGLLKNKKATGWNGDNALENILHEHGAQYTDQLVTVDGNIITGNGPEAAVDFGKAIVSLLHG